MSMFRYGAPAKPPLRQKMEKSLNSSAYMYQGKTFTAGSSSGDKKKKNVSLGNLSINIAGAKDLIQATREGTVMPKRHYQYRGCHI